jgi:hypothetical protein
MSAGQIDASIERSLLSKLSDAKQALSRGNLSAARPPIPNSQLPIAPACGWHDLLGVGRCPSPLVATWHRRQATARSRRSAPKTKRAKAERLGVGQDHLST